MSLSVSEKEVKMSKDVSQSFLVLTFILVGDLRGRQGHKTAKRGIRVKSFVWDTDQTGPRKSELLFGRKIQQSKLRLSENQGSAGFIPLMAK